MKQRVFYVSRDPAQGNAWIVAAAAMRTVGFETREQALSWAVRQASTSGKGISARVLVQDEGEHWECAFANDLPIGSRANFLLAGHAT